MLFQDVVLRMNIRNYICAYVERLSSRLRLYNRCDYGSHIIAEFFFSAVLLNDKRLFN